MSVLSAARARTLAISSPAIPEFVGRPALELVRPSGREGLNRLFEYELLLKTPEDLNLGASVAFAALLPNPSHASHQASLSTPPTSPS